EHQQLLSDVEVVGLDLALRLFDLAREHVRLDDLAFLHAGELQQALGAVRVAEDAHQRVFHRQIEARGTRITLATGAAAQLVVDAARLMPLGADDVQAARGHDLVMALLPERLQLYTTRLIHALTGRLELVDLGLEIAAQLDVGAAAG